VKWEISKKFNDWGPPAFVRELAKTFDKKMEENVGIIFHTIVVEKPVNYANTWSDGAAGDSHRIYNRWWGTEVDVEPVLPQYKEHGVGIVTVLDEDWTDTGGHNGWAKELRGGCENPDVLDGRASYNAQYWHLNKRVSKAQKRCDKLGKSWCRKHIEEQLVTLWMHEVGHLLGVEHDEDNFGCMFDHAHGIGAGAMYYSTVSKLQIYRFLNNLNAGSNNGCTCGGFVPCRLSRQGDTNKVCRRGLKDVGDKTTEQCQRLCQKNKKCGSAVWTDRLCFLCEWMTPSTPWMLKIPTDAHVSSVHFAKDERCIYLPNTDMDFYYYS